MLKLGLSLEKHVVFFKVAGAETVHWRTTVEYILWLKKKGAAPLLFAHISIII